MGKKNKKRDETILLNIIKNQQELQRGLKEYKINHPSDLKNIDFFVRRGMVQTVGDIFELTKMLSDATSDMINIDKQLVKSFRDMASHNYGFIDNETALMWIRYCSSKELINNIKEILAKTKDDSGK